MAKKQEPDQSQLQNETPEARKLIEENLSDGTLAYWYSVAVPGNGEVAVLATSEEVAGKLSDLYFLRAHTKVGIRKNKPVFGERRIKQVPARPPLNPDKSIEKDLREEARRGGLDYIVC